MSAMYAEWSEQDLIELSRDGNAEAFAELIHRTRPMCLKVAMSIMKDPVEAEDHVQSACFKAWQKLDRFRGDSKFSTWMTRIVTNECLMELRDRRRDAPTISMDDSPVDGEGIRMQIADSRRTPEEDLAAAQVANLLLDEMQRVPGFLRGVLLAAEVDKAPMDSIAQRFGLSVEAVKSRLYRARKELRKRLQKHTGRMGPATLIA